MSKIVWVVTDNDGEEGIVGVFERFEDALMACRSRTHFMGPLLLNKDYNDDDDEWDGGFRPRADL